jgi:hypothetical protein
MDFETLINYYLTRYVPRLKSAYKVKGHVKPLADFFGRLPLESLTIQRINEFRWYRLKTVKPATVNRSLAALHKALVLASQWGWIQEAPKIALEIENNARCRWLTEEEEGRLMVASPKWLQECNLSH